MLWLAAPPALAAPDCREGPAGSARVGEPTARVAWRAGLVARTPIWQSVPKRGAKSEDSIVPGDAPWLLVLRTARDRKGRCWVKVRLPSRPNVAAAWVDADRVALRPTPWRLVVSRAARAISVYRGGDLRRRFRVVIGARPTPTPARPLLHRRGLALEPGGVPRLVRPPAHGPQQGAPGVRRRRRPRGHPRPRRREPAGTARRRPQPRLHTPGEQGDQVDRPQGGRRRAAGHSGARALGGDEPAAGGWCQDRRIPSRGENLRRGDNAPGFMYVCHAMAASLRRARVVLLLIGSVLALAAWPGAASAQLTVTEANLDGVSSVPASPPGSVFAARATGYSRSSAWQGTGYRFGNQGECVAQGWRRGQCGLIQRHRARGPRHVRRRFHRHRGGRLRR